MKKMNSQYPTRNDPCPGVAAEPQDLTDVACQDSCARFLPEQSALYSHSGTPDPDRCLRIGYVSSDSFDHSTAHTFAPILNGHDSRRVEIYAYGHATHTHEVTHGFQDTCHMYRDIDGLDCESVARLITGDCIDILVALQGHGPHNCLKLLSYRLAPIQVDYGAITTTGMKQIDYRLTDECLDPVDESDDSVHIPIRLPGGFYCYRPPVHSPMVAALPALDNGYVTFGSFNNKMEITSLEISLWARVLQGCDLSRMVIHCQAAEDQQVRTRYLVDFKKNGIHPDRISFVGSLTSLQLLECMSQTDMALDTYPHNSDMASLEALWMGVPIVTLSGDRRVSRIGRALLSRLGLDIFAAADPDEYVGKAVAFAGQLDHLSAIRGSLRSLMLNSTLCDPQRLAHELEQAYQSMWHCWCRHQGVSVPDHKPTAYLRQVASVPRPEEAAPKGVDIPVDKGVCLQQAREAYQGSEFDRAECLYGHLAQHAPRFEVFERLAQICEKDMSRQTEALAWLNRARACDPGNWDVQKRIAVALLWTGQVDEAIDRLEQVIDETDRPANLELMLLWWKQYQVQCDPVEMAHGFRQWAQSTMPVSEAVPDFPNDRSPDRRLRVGYLSGDFRAHSVAYNVTGAFVGRDRECFEIFGYGSVPKPDEVTETLVGLFDTYRDVYALSDADLVQRIRADQIDILVLIGGYTVNSRFRACSYRPAPIMVDYGNIDTMGMPQIGYRLTDAVLGPPQDAKDYHEENIYLPGGLTAFTPPVHAPMASALPATRRGYMTFGSFNSIVKMNPSVIERWAQIMRRCAQSRLILKIPSGRDPGARARVLALFEQQDIDPERIDIYGHFPSQFDHLKLFNQVDMALDTFPFSGCVTTLEGLWQGVPVVTLTGSTWVSRFSATILCRLGLDAWITDDPDVYVEKAVGFAQDLEALASLRNTLRQRLTESVICDPKRFARELEQAYRMIWRRWIHE